MESTVLTKFSTNNMTELGFDNWRLTDLTQLEEKKYAANIAANQYF